MSYNELQRARKKYKFFSMHGSEMNEILIFIITRHLHEFLEILSKDENRNGMFRLLQVYCLFIYIYAHERANNSFICLLLSFHFTSFFFLHHHLSLPTTQLRKSFVSLIQPHFSFDLLFTL